MIELTINGNRCQAEDGATILAAASAGGIYIPALCSHPDLPPFENLPRAARIFRGQNSYADEPESGFPAHADAGQSSAVDRQSEGCGLCVVTVAGRAEPVRACRTPAAAGMVVETDSESLRQLRRNSLMEILARHPHACITCAQREGCSLEDCSSNVPRQERCCAKFHNCELRRVAEYVGVKEETPRYRPSGLPVLSDEPLFVRDFNLCIDCARCVRVCNQVRGVGALGVVRHNGRLLVGSVAPTLLESGCKFCGACVEVCPTGCLLDKQTGAGERAQWLVPCVGTCPAGVNVPEYIRRIAAGDFRGAAAVVRERLPLPNVLGYICFHLCENECRRGELDEPIAICALKRFALSAGDEALAAELKPRAETGKRVAVVGAGPAGLTAGYFLRLKGHAVTIFEAAERPGGMPALSIPRYRLPPEALERDVAEICRLGIELRTGCRLETGAAMAGLRQQGFDAVLIAVGLPYSRRLGLPGVELDGVFWGLEFLSAVKAGKRFELGREVVVVGGGNVAIDVAMTALRLSGGSVRLFCLEDRAEMPAHAHEIARAEAEGVEINCRWGPAAIHGSAGHVGSVEFRRCLAVFDDERNFAPTFDEQQRITVTASSVILAIGQAPPKDIPAEGDGVFLAGDIVGGELSVVHAVASGRGAAERIDRHLGGDGDLSLLLGGTSSARPWLGRETGFAPRPRVPITCTAPTQRRASFELIEGAYGPTEAQAEARRCLQCDLRLLLAAAPRPPERWLEFNQQNVAQVPTGAGVFVLADESRTPILIKGEPDLRAALEERLAAGGAARYFFWEEEQMYSRRESELIQQHLQQYGQLPGGGDELDELF